MKQWTNLNYAALCLSFVGGCCDAITFIVVAELFSAHVTGNFIEFSRELVMGSEGEGWSKLMVFPVFVVAVMTGGTMLSRMPHPTHVLWLEAVLMTLCGLVSLCYANEPHLNYFLALVLVFAMGLQNAFGKIFSNQLHGSTTVMTGNVTQLSLDLAQYFFYKRTDQNTLLSLKQNAIIVVGFLAGALTGALGAKYWGIAAILLPAVLVFHLSTTSSFRKKDTAFG